jgi:Leucine-rich repeat (LRR) protein
MTCSVAVPIESDKKKLSPLEENPHNRTKNSVKGFYMNRNKEAKFIPCDIGKEIPALEAFEVSECSLMIIRKENFANMANLKLLNLNRNQINSISRESFRLLFNLERLTLKGNQIESLDSRLLNDLENLKVFVVSNNQLQTLSEGFFEKNPKLQGIWLDNNLIETLSAEVFKKENIWFVDLSANQCINETFSKDTKGNSKMFIPILDEILKKNCSEARVSTQFPCVIDNISVAFVQHSKSILRSHSFYILIGNFASYSLIISNFFIIFRFSRQYVY